MRHLLRIALLALLLVAAGCSKPAGDSAEPQTSEHQSAGAEQSDEHFAIDTQTNETQLSVEVTPRNGFKINTEYPWQLNFVNAPEGAPATLSSADAATLDEATARFEVEREVFGDREEQQAELRFSVCNDETCLLKTKQITWQLP